MDIELFYAGTERIVYVYGGCGTFVEWASRLSRPPEADLLRAIHLVANRPYPDLIGRHYLWKRMSGTKPKLYAIRSDQARIYCCLLKGDVVMLDWIQKKQQRAPTNALKRAQRRAAEVLGNE